MIVLGVVLIAVVAWCTLIAVNAGRDRNRRDDGADYSSFAEAGGDGGASGCNDSGGGGCDAGGD